MKRCLAWNSGKSHSQSYQPISVFCHALLTMGTPLFHAKRCFLSPLFLWTNVKFFSDHWMGYPQTLEKYPNKHRKGRPEITSASGIRRPDPSSLPVSDSTRMVPYIRLQAPPTDIRTSAFSHPLPPPTLWLTSFLDDTLVFANGLVFREATCTVSPSCFSKLFCAADRSNYPANRWRSPIKKSSKRFVEMLQSRQNTPSSGYLKWAHYICRLSTLTSRYVYMNRRWKRSQRQVEWHDPWNQINQSIEDFCIVVMMKNVPRTAGATASPSSCLLQRAVWPDGALLGRDTGITRTKSFATKHCTAFIFTGVMKRLSFIFKLERPTFPKIKVRLNKVIGNVSDNIVDVLFKRMEQYARYFYSPQGK